MNFFYKFLIQKADKIKAAEKLKQHSDSVKQHESWKELSLLRKEAFEKIKEKLTKITSEMMQLPTHVNVGDEVILNVYSIGGDPYNGWDGGPNSYIKNCGDRSPVILRITDISVDCSLANDRIENWIEKQSIEYLKCGLYYDSLIRDYEQFYNRTFSDKVSLGFGVLGLYLSANFEPVSHKFKPIWGLNIGSFLKLNSEEGQKTLDVWNEEEEIKKKIKSLDEEKEKLTKRKEEIDFIFRDIKIIK